jgi:hypothetical protein
MRTRRYATVILSSVLAVGAGSLSAPVALGAPGVSLKAAPAAVAPPSNLYVAACSSTGDGSFGHPFCTLAEAAAVAQPGQTVVVRPGRYEETLNITRSGTPGAPITFVAENGDSGFVRLNYSGLVKDAPMVSVSGVHDVVVRGFTGQASGKTVGIDVVSSSDVRIDQVIARLGRGTAGVHVGGSAEHITISRNTTIGGLSPAGTGIAVDSGAADVQLSGNDIEAGAGIVVQDSPGILVTGNTVLTECLAGITLGGTSPSATLANNIVRTSAGMLAAPTACPTPSAATGVVVSAASTAGTRADFNLIDPSSAGALYSWAGADFSDLPSFRTATGQGARDIAADPQLVEPLGSGTLGWHALAPTSPARDSADLDAAGELGADLLDNGRANDPSVADSGSGAVDYADRGATELLGPIAYHSGSLIRRPGGGPLEALADGRVTPTWEHTGTTGLVDYRFDGAVLGTRQVTHGGSVPNTFPRAGINCATVTTSANGFRAATRSSAQTCMLFGADYTPIAPTRIVHTAGAVGVKTKTPLAAGATITVPVPAVAGVPAAEISALVLNVTAVGAKAVGGLAVYSAGGTVPSGAAVNFPVKQTRSNLVTVPLTSGISIRNTSKGTVHVIVDVQGYYSGTGSRFKPTAPARVLDTVKGTGAPAGVVKAHATLTLNLSSRVPTTATAVALTVTVTKPTAAGGVTVYPTGQTRRASLDLNYIAKSTVTNLVVARVAAGKVSLYNTSAGTLHLTGDLTGWYGPLGSGATQSFVPQAPVKLRSAGTAAVAAKGTVDVITQQHPEQYRCSTGCALPTMSILDITAKGTAAGSVTAYPTGTTRPGSATVSYPAGQVVSNLATVMSTAPISLYNNSTGKTQIVVEQQGYFIAGA